MNTGGQTSVVTWTGESLISRLIRTVIIPAIRSKSLLRDVARYVRFIEKSRVAGEASPPKRVAKRYDISARAYAGADAVVVEPRGVAPTITIVYIHGGAYVAHLDRLQWNLIEALARHNNARVIVPHYPLAPEHDWQPAYAMMMALYDDLLRETSADQIVLSGDSAGAGLALGFAQALRDAHRPRPGKIVLFSPWLDLREDNPAQAAFDAADPLLARPALVWAGKAWAGATPLEDSRISPVLGDLRGLPPMLVFSGTADLLHADALALLSRARENDHPVRLVIGERMTHAWSVVRTAETARLHREVAAFLR